MTDAERAVIEAAKKWRKCNWQDADYFALLLVEAVDACDDEESIGFGALRTEEMGKEC